MAAGKELLLMPEPSNENPIGPVRNYVDEKQQFSKSERTTIDSLHFTEHNTRGASQRSIYNYNDSVNDLTGLEDDEINTGINADISPSGPFLPRLVFLDSDENITLNIPSENRNIENRQQRSASDSVVIKERDQQYTVKLLQKQGQENNCCGYTNQISKNSVQSSDSELLTDHNVMDTNPTEINMTILKGGKGIKKGDDTWHCHLKNTKIPPDRMARNQLIAVSILCFLFMIGEAIGSYLCSSFTFELLVLIVSTLLQKSCTPPY